MKKAVLMLLLWGGLLSGQGWAASLSQVVDALESPFRPGSSNRVHDVRAEFFQESRIASLDRTQRGQGRVSFLFEPGRGQRGAVAMFNWEYDAPSRQQIVSDGETMWVYLPENRQVIESDVSQVSQANAANPITFLSGLGNISRDFSISWAEPNTDAEGNYVLELRPRRISQLIRQLILVVDREALQAPGGAYFPILSSTVIDPSDNRTIIEFRDIRVNRGLDRLDFRFMQPPGVEVVRPSGKEMGF